MKSRTNPSKS